MADYLILMHDDGLRPVAVETWGPYLDRLGASGHFRGGSAIGPGLCVRKEGPTPGITAALGGYLRVEAGSFDEARGLLAGNPVFEAGGTIEIRELPRSEP